MSAEGLEPSTVGLKGHCSAIELRARKDRFYHARSGGQSNLTGAAGACYHTAMSKLHPVTSDTFESEVLQASQPVVLEFGAGWCQPCRVLEPLLEQLAEDWEGYYTFAKLDVDQAAEITARYGVLSVPTTILFKDGQEVERLVGLQPKQKLWDRLSAHKQ